MPTIELTPESVRDGLSPEIVNLIDEFDPLPFEAGVDAKDWLQGELSERSLPITAILMPDAEHERLDGFICMGFTSISLSRSDQAAAEVGIVQKGRRVEEVCEPHLAADISWIARGAATRKGFGQRLFNCAVNWGMDNRVLAMVVTPHDEETERKVWIERFRFREAHPSDAQDGAPKRLWYPVHKPTASWPS